LADEQAKQPPQMIDANAVRVVFLFLEAKLVNAID
jgi:hypothetical protein